MALNEKWFPVFQNEELARKVLPLSPEEAQKVLAENGFDFTIDEILDAGNELSKMQERLTSGELDEDDLEDVSGGASRFWSWETLKNIFKTVAKMCGPW